MHQKPAISVMYAGDVIVALVVFVVKLLQIYFSIYLRYRIANIMDVILF